MTIASMERNVETEAGVSDLSYGNRRGEPPLNGMVQEKADAPQLATQQSDVCMKAHKAIAPGLHLRGANPARAIEHHNVAIVDDTDGHVSGDTGEDDAVADAAAKVQHSGQT